MKFKNIRRWSINPSIEGLLFFAQRLDELLWDFTLDTYKPMALNAPYLCKEAIVLIKDIEKELIESANLRPVLEELIWSVQNDPIAKSLLDDSIENYVLLGDDIKLTEVNTRLEVLSRTLEPYRYLHKSFDIISNNVKNIKKKNIDSACRSMVTTMLNMGVSKQFLFKCTNDFFFSSSGPKIENPKIIDDFLKFIYPYQHDCVVYFLVSDLIESVKDSLDNFQIELLQELPKDLNLLAHQNSFIKGPNESYVAIGPLKALDVFSAQENAANRLDSLSDLFTLFYHQQKIKWQPIALVQQCCLDSPVAVTLTKGAMEKPFDLRPEKASKELNRLLRNIAFTKDSASLNRFNRVADLHGICVSTDIPENQLVTLWTAIETLIPSSTTKKSKIINIVEAMVPFLMNSYIRRIIQRFTHDLVTWKPWEAKAILNKVPGINGPSTFHRALALLAVKENQPIRDELYLRTKDFQLLKYRAFQLSEMLSSTEKLKRALETHEKKLRWQIRRIYRTRNLIVHSGQSASYLHAIISNGHDYLDQIVFDVMKFSCGEYRVEKLSQAFELAQIRYGKFKRNLGEVGDFNVMNCEFLCADLDALSDFQNQSWNEK